MLQVRVVMRAGVCLEVLSRREDFTVIATIPHSVYLLPATTTTSTTTTSTPPGVSGLRDQGLYHDLIFAKCLQRNDRPVSEQHYSIPLVVAIRVN